MKDDDEGFPEIIYVRLFSPYLLTYRSMDAVRGSIGEDWPVATYKFVSAEVVKVNKPEKESA